MRALAEAPRLLLHYTKLEYDDIMSWDYYGKEWSEIKSKVHDVYEEAPEKVFDPPIEIDAMIEWDSSKVTTNQFGTEKYQKITVKDKEAIKWNYALVKKINFFTHPIKNFDDKI